MGKNTSTNGRTRSQRTKCSNTKKYTTTVIDFRPCSVDKVSADTLQLRDIGPVRQVKASLQSQWKKYGWIIPELCTTKAAEQEQKVTGPKENQQSTLLHSETVHWWRVWRRRLSIRWKICSRTLRWASSWNNTPIAKAIVNGPVPFVLIFVLRSVITTSLGLSQKNRPTRPTPAIYGESSVRSSPLRSSRPSRPQSIGTSFSTCSARKWKRSCPSTVNRHSDTDTCETLVNSSHKTKELD